MESKYMTDMTTAYPNLTQKAAWGRGGYCGWILKQLTENAQVKLQFVNSFDKKHWNVSLISIAAALDGLPCLFSSLWWGLYFFLSRPIYTYWDIALVYCASGRVLFALVIMLHCHRNKFLRFSLSPTPASSLYHVLFHPLYNSQQFLTSGKKGTDKGKRARSD